ncbi:hypothetical protein HGB25_02370 [Candidatus Saccharibacteria bacterium]|nr:hypothetical protein [Candidatus Saccharibacteria bacterium]
MLSLFLDKRKEHVQVFNDQQPDKVRSPKRTWMVVGAILLIVILAAGAYVAYNMLFLNKNAGNSKPVKDEKTYFATISEKTNVIVTSKGYAAGQVFLDEELKKTTSTQNQSQIYSLKSVHAGSFGGGNDKALALEYAYKAESLFPDKTTALSIASLEDGMSNTSNAIKYYKLYLERAKTGTALSKLDQADYDYYAAKVKKLESRGD